MALFTSVASGNWTSPETWWNLGAITDPADDTKIIITGVDLSGYSIPNIIVSGSTGGLNDGTYAVDGVVFSSPNTVVTIIGTFATNNDPCNVVLDTYPETGDSVEYDTSIDFDLPSISGLDGVTAHVGGSLSGSANNEIDSASFSVLGTHALHGLSIVPQIIASPGAGTISLDAMYVSNGILVDSDGELAFNDMGSSVPVVLNTDCILNMVGDGAVSVSFNALVSGFAVNVLDCNFSDESRGDTYGDVSLQNCVSILNIQTPGQGSTVINGGVLQSGNLHCANVSMGNQLSVTDDVVFGNTSDISNGPDVLIGDVDFGAVNVQLNGDSGLLHVDPSYTFETNGNISVGVGTPGWGDDGSHFRLHTSASLAYVGGTWTIDNVLAATRSSVANLNVALNTSNASYSETSSPATVVTRTGGGGKSGSGQSSYRGD